MRKLIALLLFGICLFADSQISPPQIPLPVSSANGGTGQVNQGTLSFSNSIQFTGPGGSTYSGPGIARTNTAQTFNSVQGINTNITGLPTVPSAIAGSVFNLGAADGTNTAQNVFSFAGTSLINGYRADGTNASQSALQATEHILGIRAYGFDGTAWSARAADIEFNTVNTWTGSDHSTSIQFLVTPTSSTTITSEMSLTGAALNVIPPITANAYSDHAGNLIVSSTAPTLASGGCSTASITTANSTAAFTVTNSGSCTGSQPLVFTLPAAAHSWHCTARDITTTANVQQTGAASTTSVTITNYSLTTGLAQAWTSNDVVEVSCMGY